jgi:tetratricopeptide (TPR) repeat protein
VKKKELLHLLTHPYQISFKEFEKMDKIVAKYPYFSTLKMIMAKAALELNLPDQTTRLHSAAIAVPNRQVLKLLMEFTPEAAQQIGTESTNKPEEKELIIAADEEITSEIIEELLNINEREDEKTILEDSSVMASKFEEQKQIIDNFIKSNIGGIKPNKAIDAESEVQKDLSIDSVKLSDNIASENLAVVFEKQGKKAKAVRIYEKLILKYPEKRTYFAGRIEELKRN